VGYSFSWRWLSCREVNVDLFASRFSLTKPRCKIIFMLLVFTILGRLAASLPSILWRLSNTPPHIDFQIRQRAGLLYTPIMPDRPKLEQAGEERTRSPAVTTRAVSEFGSNNEPVAAQGVKDTAAT
jgi:hypothetical protein